MATYQHARWCFNVTKWTPTKDEWLKLTSSVASDELDRIKKFVYQDDCKSSLVGCALIRKFLAHSTHLPSNVATLSRNQYGRPQVSAQFIAHHPQHDWPKLLDFNVSHSGDYCVLAGIWSQDKQENNITIGVDVTKIIRKNTKQDLDRFLNLMSRREFTKAEWEIVEQAASDRQKCVNFTRLWCLKESLIKSIGMGLSFKLSRIDFKFNQAHKYDISIEMLKRSLIDSTTVLIDQKEAFDWRFYETALDDEHMVAIGYNVIGATSTSDLSYLHGPLFCELSIDSIINSLTPIRQANDNDWLHFVTRDMKRL